MAQDQQQPGQFYIPGDNQQQNLRNQVTSTTQSNTQPNNSQPSPANKEVAEIDNAVQSAPQQPPIQDSESQDTQSSVNAAQIQPSPPQQAAESNKDYQEAQLVTNSQPDEQNEPPEMPAESNVSVPQDQEVPENTEPESDQPLLAWEAAEPAEINTQNIRAMLVFLAAAVIVAFAIVWLNGVNFSTVVSIIVIALAVVAVIVSSRQHSHLESYAIYEDGVTIGPRFYPFSQWRAFSVVAWGNAASIELEPVQRFMVRRVIHLDSGTAEQVVELLGYRLPYEERSQSMIDQLNNKLNL